MPGRHEGGANGASASRGRDVRRHPHPQGPRSRTPSRRRSGALSDEAPGAPAPGGRARARDPRRDEGLKRQRTSRQQPGPGASLRIEQNDSVVVNLGDGVHVNQHFNFRSPPRNNKPDHASRSEKGPPARGRAKGHTQPCEFTAALIALLTTCAHETGFEHGFFALMLRCANPSGDCGDTMAPLSALAEGAWMKAFEQLERAGNLRVRGGPPKGAFGGYKKTTLRNFASAHVGKPLESTATSIGRALKTVGAQEAFKRAVASWRKVVGFCGSDQGKELLLALSQKESCPPDDAVDLDPPEASSSAEEHENDTEEEAAVPPDHVLVTRPAPPALPAAIPDVLSKDVLALAVAGDFNFPHAVIYVSASRPQIAHIVRPFSKRTQTLPIANSTARALQEHGLVQPATPAYLPWNMAVAVVACSPSLPREAFTSTEDPGTMHATGEIPFYIRNAVLVRRGRRGPMQYALTGSFVPAGNCNNSSGRFSVPRHVANKIILPGYASLRLAPSRLLARQEGPLQDLASFGKSFGFKGNAHEASDRLDIKGPLRMRAFGDMYARRVKDTLAGPSPIITTRLAESEPGSRLISRFNEGRRCSHVSFDHSPRDLELAALLLGMKKSGPLAAKECRRTKPKAVSALNRADLLALATRLKQLSTTSGLQAPVSLCALGLDQVKDNTVVLLHLPVPPCARAIVRAHGQQVRSTRAAVFGPGAARYLSLTDHQDPNTILVHRVTICGSDFQSKPPSDFRESCSLDIGRPVPSGLLDAREARQPHPNLLGYPYTRVTTLSDAIAAGSPLEADFFAPLRDATNAQNEFEEGFTVTLVEDGTTPIGFSVGEGCALVIITATYGPHSFRRALESPLPLSAIEHECRARAEFDFGVARHLASAPGNADRGPQFNEAHERRTEVLLAAYERAIADPEEWMQHARECKEQAATMSAQRSDVRRATGIHPHADKGARSDFISMIDDKYADGSRTRYVPYKYTAFRRHCHMNPNGASDEITARHTTAPQPRYSPVTATKRQLLTFGTKLGEKLQQRKLALHVYDRYKGIGSNLTTPSLVNGKEPARQHTWHNAADYRLTFTDYSQSDDDADAPAVEAQGSTASAANSERDEGDEDVLVSDEEDEFDIYGMA